MAKQANRLMIGGFVVTAVIIMAASLVVFGSGKFFKKTQKYVLYFDGSIKGLSVGAPVLFQGVQIGSVTSISIQADLTDNMKIQIPVIIDLEPDRWKVTAGERDRWKMAPKLIEKGLRAVLTTQSFITGQLAIELDFYPEAALCRPPAQIDKAYKDYMVIPTCQSTTERLAQTLGKLDLDKLQNHLESALAGIDKFANNPDLAASIQALRDTLQGSSKLVEKVGRKVDPLADDMKKAVNDVGKLAREAGTQIGGVAAGLQKTMTSTRGVLSEDSPLMAQLENTLKELAAMSRTFRQLADYLDQHPEALLRGKGSPGGK
ncbi:MAG: MlaD family protein [Desulfobaccales bacterium]